MVPDVSEPSESGLRVSAANPGGTARSGGAFASLVRWSLQRRNQCSVTGLRRWRTRLFGVVVIALATYGALYAITTWLGTSREARGGAST
jgi:hypothetical protein